MKNYPLLQTKITIFFFLWSMLSACSPVPALEAEAASPFPQSDAYVDSYGEVQFDPGEDLVAYTWNGDFFEETHFPGEYEEHLDIYATPLSFDAPIGAFHSSVNGSTLVLSNMQSGEVQEVDLNTYSRFYIGQSNGTRRFYKPCSNGRKLNSAFGSGNTIHIYPPDENKRYVTDNEGNVTTILIATDLSDDPFRFFYPIFSGNLLSSMPPVSTPSFLPNALICPGYGAQVTAPIVGYGVDLVQCGNMLNIVTYNQLGLPSCGGSIDLKTTCSFCIEKQTSFDANGYQLEILNISTYSPFCGLTYYNLCSP